MILRLEVNHPLTQVNLWQTLLLFSSHVLRRSFLFSDRGGRLNAIAIYHRQDYRDTIHALVSALSEWIASHLRIK
jgi:hypothetical protein